MDAGINPEQNVSSLEQILRVSLEEEEEAIRVYTEIPESLSLSNVILFQTIQEILRDDQEHREELDALQNPPKE